MMNDENKREGEEEVPRQRYAFPPFLLPSVLFYFSPPSLPPSLPLVFLGACIACAAAAGVAQGEGKDGPKST